MVFDPPGRFIHWKAIAILLIPPILGLMAHLAWSPINIFLAPIIWLLALPFVAVLAWIYSCYVADTHTQPWGIISFFAFIGSGIGGLMITCSHLTK